MVSIKSNVFQPDLDLMHLVVLAIGLSQAGCTDEVCTPGATQVCVCPGGKQGAQHCNSQGTGWEISTCPMGCNNGSCCVCHGGDCCDGCNYAPSGTECDDCKNCNSTGSCSQNKPDGSSCWYIFTCSGGKCLGIF